MLRDRLFQAASVGGEVSDRFYVGNDDGDVVEIFYDNTANVLNTDASGNVIWSMSSDGVHLYYSLLSVTPWAAKIDINTGVEVWRYESTPAANVYQSIPDASGNVHVSNQNFDVEKLNSAGGTIWTTSIGTFGDEPDALAVDLAGNVYCGTRDPDWKKLNSAGSLIFTNTDHSDDISGIQVDASGNVYTASKDNTVRKTNSSNVNQWIYNAGEDCYRLDQDGAGNLYVGLGNGDVRKIDSLGSLVWSTNISAGVVWDVAYDFDADKILCACLDNDVVVLDSSGTEIQRYTGFTSPVRAICSKRGRYPIFF